MLSLPRIRDHRPDAQPGMEAVMTHHRATPAPGQRRAAVRRQAGIALPVMLIMLAVMLISSIYLLKSSTSTTLTTSNLAYDSALAKAADLGVYKAYQWISTVDKSTLIANIPSAGYVASMAPELSVSNESGFWTGYATFTDNASPPNQIQYVIHRLCTLNGLYNAPLPQSCMKSTPKINVASGIGNSQAEDAVVLAPEPQL